MDEVCAFTSISDFMQRPAGLIRHTVMIPSDLLNTGSYDVNLFVVKDTSVAILFQSNVVGFEVLEGEISGNWYGRTAGATRPKLRWESEVIKGSDFPVAMSALRRDA